MSGDGESWLLMVTDGQKWREKDAVGCVGEVTRLRQLNAREMQKICQ